MKVLFLGFPEDQSQHQQRPQVSEGAIHNKGRSLSKLCLIVQKSIEINNEWP